MHSPAAQSPPALMSPPASMSKVMLSPGERQAWTALLQSALGQSNGVQVRAADVLGISYRSFRHLMKKYEL